jgi:hypothetical protein
MHDRTREMAKDGTLMQFGRRSRGKLFGFAGMEIEGATELLEKCKAKGVLHKAEAEFIKGFASDMILFPVQLRTAQARHHGRAEENHPYLKFSSLKQFLAGWGIADRRRLTRRRNARARIACLCLQSVFVAWPGQTMGRWSFSSPSVN